MPYAIQFFSFFIYKIYDFFIMEANNEEDMKQTHSIFSPSKGNGHRGFNLANINGTTGQI